MKPFDNTVGKGEKGGNQQFLRFSPCFLTIPERISVFELHLCCCLQMLSIWTSLKFCGKQLPYFGAYNTHIFSALNNFKHGTACYTLQ